MEQIYLDIKKYIHITLLTGMQTLNSYYTSQENCDGIQCNLVVIKWFYCIHSPTDYNFLLADNYHRTLQPSIVFFFYIS